MPNLGTGQLQGFSRTLNGHAIDGARPVRLPALLLLLVTEEPGIPVQAESQNKYKEQAWPWQSVYRAH